MKANSDRLQSKILIDVDKMIMAVFFQGVENLDNISLGGSRKKVPTGRFYTGKDCEWIDLNKVKS